MTKVVSRSKVWTKPQITRLGELKDVAGGTGQVVQGQPNRS